MPQHSATWSPDPGDPFILLRSIPSAIAGLHAILSTLVWPRAALSVYHPPALHPHPSTRPQRCQRTLGKGVN